jgi:hypothetical protein
LASRLGFRASGLVYLVLRFILGLGHSFALVGIARSVAAVVVFVFEFFFHCQKRDRATGISVPRRTLEPVMVSVPCRGLPTPAHASGSEAMTASPILRKAEGAFVSEAAPLFCRER